MFGVSTNDGDFAGVMVDLGVRINLILYSSKKDTMFNIQRFMLDMHPDIVCTVKYYGQMMGIKKR